MHEVIMPDVLQIGMFKLLHGWITIICYLFTFKLLEVLFVDTMIQVAVMGHWWRYHQCHCRRRQQCLLKLYNLERLNPELCHWRLQCYVWECYQISFQLSCGCYYFSWASWACAWEWQVRRKFLLLRWANNGSGLQVYWNASASCQCSEISTMEYDGYQLAWVWVVLLMSKTPSCQWAYQ